MTESVVILGGARTAIGTFGGGLKDQTPSDLGALVITEALKRSGVTGADIGHVVMGNIIHTEARDMYVSRVAALNAGIAQEAPALTVNRLCGSGLQAIISAAQTIMLGDCTAAVGGGTEVMSRAGYLMPAARWGARMGDTAVVDMMLGALSDPFGGGHMGITAENVADRYGFTREEQDAFAVESQRRAAAAIAAGRFKDQIVPVVTKTRKGEVTISDDEYPKPETTLEVLQKLRPAFSKDGTVTAGNASGINDGAAALVVMSAEEARKRGITPLARIASWATAGVDPSIMGTGPIPASQRSEVQVCGPSTTAKKLTESAAPPMA